MQKSIWQDNADLPSFPSLEGTVKTDVLVVGGGISGILCAYFLKEAGIDCVLAEKNRICQGVTFGTTAKITSQHGLIYNYLSDNFGKEIAQKYFFANENAVKTYEELCQNIDCDFEKKQSFVYSKDDMEKIEKEVKVLSSIGADAFVSYNLPLPLSIAGAVGVKNQAQFDPFKFVKHIARNLRIFENTEVTRITPKGADCKNGKIQAKKIIVATHFPFINSHGAYFLKMYQHRSYVLALENAQKPDGMFVDEKDGGLSFRSSEEYLLLGGCGARTGKKCGGWRELERFAKRKYPESRIKYRWATQDCMSLDKIPYIGNYSKKTPNLYVATGFNKWGMTSSMVSALILCDLVQEKQNEYAHVFSPSRSIAKPQLFVNGFETICNFAIPTAKRCPHLGCALKWNKHEHSWDCSCHGSRFKKDGTLINNPATKDANVSEPKNIDNKRF